MCSPIAVIGVGCWYPGAADTKALWENILSRRREFRRMPDMRLPLAEYHHPDPSVPDMTYGTRAAVIDGFAFDWEGHRIPKSTYDSSDIVHWLALEVANKCFEDAGYKRGAIPTDNTGVIVGNSVTGEQTRSSSMRLRWPFVRRALRAAGRAKGLDEASLESLSGTMESYYKSVFAPFTDDSLAGALSNTIAGRLCNYFDFKGGGFTVDGACSSSLIAIATAAIGLERGEADLALAGGVDISLDTFELIGFAKVGALTSKDMTVYDRRASGFIPGEGCGFVLLKRLEDARRDGNYVYSVINGWGISSDGKGGMTAPNRDGQALAMKRAYLRSPYKLSDLAFVEGHGTATRVGDKTELEAIAMAAGGDAPKDLRSIGVTSFKSIVGHTKAAAGVGGFIKTVLATNQRIIPPTAGCKDPNAVFGGAGKRLYPVLQGESLAPDAIVRAGVSSMGFGGINCHITMESGDAPAARLQPKIPARALMVSSQDSELFTLSAHSAADLDAKLVAFEARAFGISLSELTDLAAMTASELDQKKPFRAAFLVNSPEHLIETIAAIRAALAATPPAKGEIFAVPQIRAWMSNEVQKTRVGFLYPGQGSQQLASARMLVERFAWAQELVALADQKLDAEGLPRFSSRIYPPLDRAINEGQTREWQKTLAQTEVAQPAICLSSLLWQRFLATLGVKPAAVGGHSLGELTAFSSAGGFDAGTLLGLAALRGRAMAASAEAGTMASLGCSREAAEAILAKVSGYVTVANINSPKQVAISGERLAVEEAVRLALEAGHQARALPVSNAFHSRLVQESSAVLRRDAKLPATFEGNGAVELISSVDGRSVTKGRDLKAHFADQVLAQVDFLALVRALGERCDVLVEVGPGRVLTGLATDIGGASCFPIEGTAGNDTDFNVVIAQLFLRGVELDLAALYENRLVRPFVAANAKNFVENPCERPFQVEGLHIEPMRSGGTSPAIEALINSGISPAELESYLDRRGGFIADVIRADIHSSGGAVAGFAPRAPLAHGYAPPVAQNKRTASKVPVPGGSLPGGHAGSRNGSIEAMVIALAAKKTGFAEARISPDAKLLDDLNLDSIKASELVANAANAFGIAGQIDPATLANATIRQVAEALQALVGPTTEHAERTSFAPPAPASQQADVEALLIKLISNKTGFAPGSISSEARLLDDLNLDSIKAGEVIASAAKTIGATGGLDPAALANVTIRAAAAALVAAGPTTSAAPTPGAPRPNGAAKPKASSAEGWVRSFVMTPHQEPISDAELAQWKNARVMIACEPAEVDLAGALQDALTKHGAAVEILGFEAVDPQALTVAARPGTIVGSPLASSPLASFMAKLTHRIAILPRQVAASAGEVRATIRRLQSIQLTPATTGCAIAYVQFAEAGHGNALGTASAFAKSLHIERPEQKVRVIELAADLKANVAAALVAGELSTTALFSEARYDADGVRSVVGPRVLENRELRPRTIVWSKTDVVLVTGGAKGITAECALALAQQIGARFALAGRAAGNVPEVAATLKRFADAGLECRYYACDMGNREAVLALVESVKADLGPITGVVHGAGLNQPRRVEQVDAAAAEIEVAPKLNGAIYLAEALASAPPKMFVALSSLIGAVGGPGNAWYGYSNEALGRVVRAFGSAHPETTAQVMSFGIWDSVGMGVRFGALLEKLGVGLIPLEEGKRRFTSLWMNDPGAQDVVVTARLVGGDAWRWKYAPRPLPAASRFLEGVESLHIGVECTTRPRLTVARDPYLKDHEYNGSLLLPTVFGLEAMAQVAAAAAGLSVLGATRVVDIQLTRPIVVDPQEGLTIEISAAVSERQGAEPTRVKVTIGTEMTGFTAPHFAATFELTPPAMKEASGEPASGEATIVPGREATVRANTERVTLIRAAALPIRPKEDLYSWLLFQGPLFQRIETVETLDEKRVVYTADSRVPAANELVGKDAPTTAGPWILGDPYLRDAMLQSAQLCLTPDIVLPVQIAELEIFGRSDGARQCATDIISRKAKEFIGNCLALDADGTVVERITGLRGRVVETRKDYPAPAALSAKFEIEAQLARALEQATVALGGQRPALAAAYLPGLSAMTKPARHVREVHLLEASASRRSDNGKGGAHPVEWLDSGQPVLVGDAEAGLSLSHEGDLCVAVSGTGPQGCDLARLTARSERDWLGLLGAARGQVLADVVATGDAIDRAGTRIWAAIEATQKVTGDATVEVTSGARIGEAQLFTTRGATRSAKVVTFPINLAGIDHVFAVSVETAPIVEHSPLISVDPAPVSEEPGAFGMAMELVNGRLHSVNRFPVSFKHCANLSRTVYFSNYFEWLGSLREFTLWAVRDRLESLILAGDAGLVTNAADMQFLGTAGPSDVIEARLWLERVLGSAKSTLDLRCEFYKISQVGKRSRLASGRMRTTWVRVLGHGDVVPAAFPDFVQDMVDAAGASSGEGPLEKVEPPPYGVGLELFRALPGAHVEVARDTFDTGLEDSNLIGNLYYANYFKWQGKVRDRFFYGLAPELFRGFGSSGEAYVLNSRAEFLRDAMPFDRIVVAMSVTAVYQFGATFRFEYFAADGSGGTRKLAVGEQDIAWVKQGVAVALPPAFVQALIAADPRSARVLSKS